MPALEKGRLPWVSSADVKVHNHEEDCWISFLGKVFDLTSLLAQHKDDPLSIPILRNAGEDISHWFDPKTCKVNLECHEHIGILRPVHAAYIALLQPSLCCT